MSCPHHPEWVHDREDCPLCSSERAYAVAALDELQQRFQLLDAENKALRERTVALQEELALLMAARRPEETD